MTSAHDHTARVRELIALEPPVDGDASAVTGWLQRVCRAAARDLSAMGVGVCVVSGGSEPINAAASSAASLLVDELQFALGEGPCIDAYAARSPVLVPDLLTAASTTWPGYAPAAYEHGVRAVFAFPLQVGAARLGALVVYRSHTGSMSLEMLSHALTFADVVMEGLLDGHAEAGPSALFDELDDSRVEVYQAQGMLLVQLGVSAEEALARLRGHAYAHERRLIDVARDILARRLRLESDG